MEFVVLSDTHRRHRKLRNLPKADVIIHAGDISSKGTAEEVGDFLNWFSRLDYEHKIFIAGNHDFLLEQATAAELLELIPPGVTYLNDSGVTIGDINIWGSPITPWFHDWAFNRNRGKEIAQHWELIPANTDILVVHGPVQGILDFTHTQIHAGCEELLKKVKQVRPPFFISGHIHEARGEQEEDGTRYINASVLNERYQLTSAPITFRYQKEAINE